MRHLSKCETLNVLLLAIVISSLIIAPLTMDLISAQSQDMEPPYIAHNPTRIAIKDRPFNIIAHIYDESQIASATITLTRDGQSVTGRLPRRQTAGPVPVVVQALSNLPVYARANSESRVKGTLAMDEAANVTGVRGQYYQISTPTGLFGYVEAANCRVVVEGAMYGVAVPASMTSGGELSYQITATDVNGNVETTEPVTVKVLTQQELMALQAGSVPPSLGKESKEQKGGGGFGLGKVAFFTGVALAGGGAYYMYSQNKDKTKDEKATIDLVLTWD